MNRFPPEKLPAFSVSALLLTIVLAGCAPKAEVSDRVQLVLSTEEVQAGTAFELRFDEPVGAANQLSGQAAESPLLFEPRVPGRFVWTSSRSGVFTPTEPLALGTEYELTLRPGLRRADGQSSGAKLRQVVRTPPFGMISRMEREPNTNAYSEPEFRIWFNADVRAAEAIGYAEFRNAEGRFLQATVRQGTEEDSAEWWRGERSGRTWEETFRDQHREPAVNRHGAEPSNVAPTNTVKNLLVITPSQPLTVGKGWRLVLTPGLPSADHRHRLTQAQELAIGDIAPFMLRNVTMHHVINRAPWLQLEFSKAIDPALTNSFTNWLQILPAPPRDMTASVGGTQLHLSDGWQRGIDYVVTVRRGFPAKEAFALAAAQEHKLAVPPVAPRLYFPEFSPEQLAGGRRIFPLLAVNVPRIRVRAKLLEPQTTIHALRGYASYFRPEGGYGWPLGEFRRVDYNLVPGRTVREEVLKTDDQPDAAQEILLGWDHWLEGRKTGVVFLEAERVDEGQVAPRLGTQALVQLTDLGLLWKSAGAQLQAFVFSYTTGQPVEGVKVQLFSEENEPLAEATTDAAGAANLKLTEKADWLAVQLDGDFHVVKFREHELPAWIFGVRWDWERDARNSACRAALFTDRDAYRPGETVNVKAIVREIADDGMKIPTGTNGCITCTDSRGRQFFTTNIPLSALGSCATAIPLPAGPRGGYTVSLDVVGGGVRPMFEHAIQVQDFQPNAFEIRLQSKPAYAPAEKIELPVSAHYLFGKALNRARLHWSLRADDQPFQPEGFASFGFSRSFVEGQPEREQGSFALTGDVLLSDRSNSLISAEVPLNVVAPQPRAVSLLVEVTDINQQTLTHSASFLNHSSDFYLGLKRFEEVLEEGKALPVEIAAVATNGKPWSEPVATHLTLQRVDWHTVRVERAGRAVGFRSEAVITNVLEKDITVTSPKQLPATEEGWEGTRLEDVVAPAAGQYLLEVRSQDPAGRDVASSLTFYVTDKASLAWNYRNEVELKLVADQRQYQPGDTALILVKTPISGAARVTVERENVRRSFTTRIDGNAPSIRIPIEAGDAPNVFVSVTVVRGAAESTHQAHEPEYRVGYCQLKVEDPSTKLKIEVTPAATNSLPGEEVVVETLVRASSGAPVADAEVTLYAMDEGVLGLTDYATPDIHAMLFAERSLGVSSGISLPLLMPEDPERTTFQNKGYLGGGGGLGKLRKLFLACAYWNANLRTGPDGKVTARFTAPDSLTRYRLIAVAQATANRFGSGQSAFSVSKPLMVEPALPRFANVTDRIQARAVVLNQTAQAGEVRVSLELDDKGVSTDDQFANKRQLEKRVTLAAHGSATVEFPVIFTETGAAQWTWKARFVESSAGGFTDAVRSTLSVGTVRPLLREVHLVRVEAQSINLLAAVNPQLLAGKGTLSVTIANTRLVELSEAISELLHYPYGCVEQTCSSLLPWVLLQGTPELTPFVRRDTNDISGAVKAGISRLLTMQTASGGLSYWPRQREPMFWGSAYGGVVLALARQSGLDVPEAEFNALMNYLSRELRSEANADDANSERCLALYALALAGRAEHAYHEKLFQCRARLSTENRALLALAIATSRGNGSMVGELLRTNTTAKRREQEMFGCDARETAMRLLARVTQSTADPEVGRLVGELMQQKKRGQWVTTQGNAWALLALREYLRKVEGAIEPAAGTLSWGSRTKPFQLPAKPGAIVETFTLDPALIAEPLRLARDSGTPLYAQVVLESRPQSAQQNPQDHGLSLQRRYDRLNDDNEPQQADTFRVGDRVLVTLKLSVHEPVSYVAVDDPLPGLFEAMNTEFKTQQLAGNVPPASDSWWSDFREIRTDRVLFFADHVQRGNYLIRYVARVRAAGTVKAPAAKAEEMYDPETFGLTATESIVCQPLE